MDQKDPKPEAPEIVAQSRFLRWIDNLWYHYKWHILIGIFAIVTLVICLVQCSSRKSYDMTIAFAGGRTLNATEQNGLCAALEAALPEDFDGDGTNSVQLVTYGIYTEEELLKMYSSENSDGVRVIDNLAYGNAKKQNIDEGTAFSTFLQTGECAVWFVSPYVYEQHNMEKLSVPLSEIFGETPPDSAANEYAIRLGDTAFYQTYAAVRELPADTLIVLTRKIIYGKVNTNDSYYENCKKTFLAIVNFQASK